MMNSGRIGGVAFRAVGGRAVGGRAVGAGRSVCVGVDRVSARWFSSKKDEEKKEEGGGFFESFRRELESNPEIKKSLEELKKSKVGGKTFEEAASVLGKSAAKAASEAKESSGKVFENLGKTGESVKETSSKTFGTVKEQGSETFGAFFEELKKQIPISGLGEKKDGEKKDGESKAQDGEKTSEQANVEGAEPDVRTKFRAFRGKVFEKLPQSFGNDNKSWDEAFKAVFGIKVDKKAKKEEPKEEIWFESQDKDTGETYYYNDSGDSVWEKPEGVTIIKSPEHEAHDWAEAEEAGKPSFLEQKIIEKGAEISKLEEERDAAMAASDMKTFKELNAKVREIRKEIEKLSAQANTDAVVHVQEKKGAWEQFNENLKETPILKSIFGLGDKVADSDVAKKARDAAEDAREALETSQNPLVYKMYSVYDSVFGETEMGEAIREFRKMDPEFTIEEFVDEVQQDIAPTVIKAFLRGDSNTIDQYCAEGAGAAVKAAIKERKTAGRRMDENILSIGEIHVAAAKVVEKMGPMIVVQFMVQQINALYDLKGNVVEGSDDEIVGVFYIFALTREYDEAQAEFVWKLKEFAIGGTTPWI